MRPRKHIHALLAAAAFNFVLFFPVLFMGRLISPNDVFFNFDPWALQPHRPVQNSLINDPPTSYLTQASLLREGGAWDWNPYLASGIPGVAASSGLFSPFGFLPLLVLPLSWNYTAMLFLKFNVAFFFAYLWLREEHFGKRGAAIGALVAAGAGVMTIRWLWPATNAAALYPALLWMVRRIFNGKRNSIALMTLVAAAYGVSHFPAAMAYGAYVVLAYAVFLGIRQRSLPVRRLGEAVFAVILGLLIVSPSVAGFAQFVKRTGYLAVRENLSLTVFFPLSHFASFIAPDRLGNAAYKNWTGDPALGMFNNYVEATVYLGLLTIPLAVLGLLNRRARTRWFWVVAAAVVVAAMFGLAGVPSVIGRLPGFKYSPLARTVLILPLPAAYLAAAGSAWLVALVRRHGRAVAGWLAAAVLVLVMAGDLSLFAGRFYPYLEPADTHVPVTPTIAFLRSQPGHFRVAPFFNYLWPNSAEMFHIEDVRSHYSSEARYRRLMQRIDPTAWSGQSTVLQLNSLKFDFTDPLVAMLGVRYFIEHRSIDVVKWSIFAATEPGVKQAGAFILKPGQVLQRTVRVDAEPFYAIELPVSVESQSGRVPRLIVELIRYGAVVYSRDFSPADIAVMNKVYIPLWPFARLGDSVTLRVGVSGLSVSMLQSVPAAGESPLFYGRVKTPQIFDRELPDGRLFLNVVELPRFRMASRVLKMPEREFLARRDIDFADTAVITDGTAVPPGVSSEGSVHVVRFTNGEQRLTTDAAGPLFLASSEKLTPELRVTVDGQPARPVEINSLFAGVLVPPGHHRVRFSRRVGRGWWWPAGGAVLIFLGVAAMETAGAVRRRSRKFAFP